MRRTTVAVDESTDFTCGKCRKDGTCFECHRTLVSDQNDADEANEHQPEARDDPSLMFRCIRCKRACHYEHSMFPVGFHHLELKCAVGKPTDAASLPETAWHYQHRGDKRDDAWHCHFCRGHPFAVDIVSCFGTDDQVPDPSDLCVEATPRQCHRTLRGRRDPQLAK